MQNYEIECRNEKKFQMNVALQNDGTLDTHLSFADIIRSNTHIIEKTH